MEIPETDTKNSASKRWKSRNRNKKNSASKRWKFQKPTQRILSPYLYRQKVEIPKPGQKKFCQQKVEIPKNRDKKSLSLPLTLKMVEYHLRGEWKRGETTIMRQKVDQGRKGAEGGKRWN
ncbi:MAG: hypothetical protein V2G48_07865 [bacterium JZ-2024 1]